MKNNIIVIISILLVCVLSGCPMKAGDVSTVQQKDNASGSLEEAGVKKEKPTAEAERIRSLSSADSADYYKKREEDRLLLLRARKEYAEASDKLAFLLDRVETTSPRVQTFVASNLADYEGQEVVGALKRILSNPLPADEEMSDNPAHAARVSLDKVESAADLRRLSPDIPLSEQLAILMKYAESANSHARRNVSEYLINHANEHPAQFVPIMLTHYANRSENLIAIAQQYPIFTVQGLEGCMNSPQEHVLKNCIDLIGYLKLDTFLPKLVDVVWAYRENRLAYSHSMAGKAMASIASFQVKAFPFVEKMLKSSNALLQGDSVSILNMMQSRAAYQELKRVRSEYSKDQQIDKAVIQKMDFVIRQMEEKGVK